MHHTKNTRGNADGASHIIGLYSIHALIILALAPSVLDRFQMHSGYGVHEMELL
jgi:hypothetical protein